MLRNWSRQVAQLPARVQQPMSARIAGAQAKFGWQQSSTCERQHPNLQQACARGFSTKTPKQQEADRQAQAKAHDKRVWDRLFAQQAQVQTQQQQQQQEQQQGKQTSSKDKTTSVADQQKALDQHRNAGDLLYEYPRKSYFGLMSAGSLANIAFWSWLKGYQDSLLEGLPQATIEPTLLTYVNSDVGIGLGFGSSILFAFMVGFHARRAVAKISVVAGGEKLRITTHKFFGDYSEPKDYPAKFISANPNTKNNLILKIADEKAFFLVDTRGTFYNRPKLESLITFRHDYTGHDDLMKQEKEKNTITVRTDLPKTNLEDPSKVHQHQHQHHHPKTANKSQQDASPKVNLSSKVMQKMANAGTKVSRKRSFPNRSRNQRKK